VRSEAARLADSTLTFAEALRMAGVPCYGEGTARGRKIHCPFETVNHEDGGKEPALRVYFRHGYCFACSQRYTVTSLLSEVWQLSEEDAAYKALEKAGYAPPDPARAWEWARRAPEPDRDALARALTAWCEANCPDWASRQYDRMTARRLAEWNDLLPLVKDADDCKTWLDAAKTAMKPWLGTPP
jgi:hypothetical protein